MKKKNPTPQPNLLCAPLAPLLHNADFPTQATTEIRDNYFAHPRSLQFLQLNFKSKDVFTSTLWVFQNSQHTEHRHLSSLFHEGVVTLTCKLDGSATLQGFKKLVGKRLHEELAQCTCTIMIYKTTTPAHCSPHTCQ